MYKCVCSIICLCICVLFLCSCEQGLLSNNLQDSVVSQSSCKEKSLEKSDIISQLSSMVEGMTDEEQAYLPQPWDNTMVDNLTSYEEVVPMLPPERNLSAVEADISVAGKFELPIITNKTPLVDVMSTVLPLTVMGDLWNTQYHTNYGSPTTLSEYVKVGFLRNTSDGCYYTVNKLVDGGYAYYFFERGRQRLNNGNVGNYITDDLTDVGLVGCVYAEKVLEYDDFKDIKIGDTLEDIIAIDPAAKLVRTWIDWNKSINGTYLNSEEVTTHLLVDGILTCIYDNDDGNIVLKEMVFSSDFIFISPFIQPDYPKTFRILPQDYPPA